MTYLKNNFEWTGRSDSKNNERFYQFVQSIDLDQNIPEDTVVILGFESDEGVKRNLGRPGAADGPNALRGRLGGLACHTLEKQLLDAGNVRVDADDLESAQNLLAEYVCKLHQNKNNVLLLGGGHEIAWPHYLGLTKAYPNKKIGIVNFDAHFDLREPGGKGASSGTPFWQAHALNPDNFHYFVIGIQDYANTKTLFKTADEYNVNYLHRNQLAAQTEIETQKQLDAFIDSVDLIYLTICLDVFDVSIAPGVSAPNTDGLSLETVKILSEQLLNSKKCCSIDIAELAPNYDEQHKTARLAAFLCHNLIEKGFSK